MGDLRVDDATLESCEGTLQWLKSEFDSLEHRRDDTRGIWGNDQLRDAMHTFASNMKHHRRELAQKIADTGDKIATSREAWTEADEKLQSELEKNTSDNPNHTEAR